MHNESTEEATPEAAFPKVQVSCKVIKSPEYMHDSQFLCNHAIEWELCKVRVKKADIMELCQDLNKI